MANWVGRGREVTGTGVLRRHEATEAYDHLRLREWEESFHDALFVTMPHLRFEVEPWRNAGDCLALDRIWRACVDSGLVVVGRTRATVGHLPTDDTGWRDLALAQVSSLCLRVSNQVIEPLLGALLVAAVAGGTMPLDGVRAWWDSQCPDDLRDLLVHDWQRDLDLCLFHVSGCGILDVTDDVVTITDLGRDFLDILAGLYESPTSVE